MKHNESHDNAKSDGLQLMPVRFEFAHPTARTVGVAGTFNDWRSKTKSMIPLGNGRWLKEMVLPAGTYEYCLVVDGECMPDPLSKDYVPNPFGGRNSILKVASWPEAARLHGAPTETALPPRMVSERQGGQKSRNPPPQAATKSPNRLTAMKHNKNHDNAKSDGPQLEPVRFEFTHPTAGTVCVAGTFNDWHAEAKPLHPMGGGRWLKETVLPPGTYEYCLVVDGRWLPDPLARETVPNPFGGRNSILKVASSPQAAHLADAENLPLKNTNK